MKVKIAKILFILFGSLMALMIGPLSLSAEEEKPETTGEEKKTETVKTPVVFYEEELISYCYTYQTPDLFDLDIKDKKNGNASLKIGWDVPVGNWPGAGIGLTGATDFIDYKTKGGILSLWIKSQNGGEKIDIGFVDKDGYITRKPLNLYMGGPLTKEWQSVKIPLAGFSNKGSKWDENLNRNVSGDFQWNAVSELSFIFGRADGNPHWINIDDAVIEMNQ